MPQGTRELKRRIKSINNTRKITKAMEMVAAAKMRKAINNVLATRDYANLAWTTILNLSERTDAAKHPLLQNREVKRVALVIISSNRGLCGGFNHNIVKKALKSIEKHSADTVITDVITLGSKGRDISLSEKVTVVADFIKQDITLSVSDITSLSHLLINDYRQGVYDRIMVAYTDYVSAIRQVPRVKQLLPLKLGDEDQYLGVVGKSAGIETTKDFIAEKQARYKKPNNWSYEYLFEPNPGVVLEAMLPRLIEMQIYQAVLESDASEHSARMLSMRSASDAAGDMISDLTLVYNQARQAGITQEIAEISSGAAALEQK